MSELCFNTMNRSAYLLGDEDPDLPGQIRSAARAGFGAIGPDSYSIAAFCAGGGRVEDLDEAIRSAGLRCFELPCLLIDADAAGNRERIEELLAFAKVLRPDFVQLNVDSQVDATVIDGLREAGDRFGAEDARLAIEYLPWLPEVRNIRSTRALLARAEVPGAGVLVDTWHWFRGGASLDQLRAIPGECIGSTQFNDAPVQSWENLVDETMAARLNPGEGAIPLVEVVQVLDEIGSTAPIGVEVFNKRHESMAAVEVGRDTADAMRRVLDAARGG